MSLNGFAIKGLRVILFPFEILISLFLLPFTIFAIIKSIKYLNLIKENAEKKDFFDLEVAPSAAEIEYASNRWKLHDFPTKYGFVAELLLLNQANKVSLNLTGKKLYVEKKGNDLPDFIKENVYEKSFKKWNEDSQSIQKEHFIMGGNFVVKSAFFGILAINLIINLLLVIFSIIIALELGHFFLSIIIANTVLFMVYYYIVLFDYPNKKKSIYQMRKNYEKSIVLNVIMNKLAQARFEKETDLNYFLMYGPYGAFAIASHFADKLDIENLEIVFK